MRALRFCLCLLLMALLAAGISARGSFAAPSGELEAMNPTCPVDGRPASRQYNIPHENRLVYFCCEDCLQAFGDRPEGYVKNLPPDYFEESLPVSTPSVPRWHPPAWSRDFHLAPRVVLLLALGAYWLARRRKRWAVAGIFLTACGLLPYLLAYVADPRFHDHLFREYWFTVVGQWILGASVVTALGVTGVLVAGSRRWQTPHYRRWQFVLAALLCLGAWLRLAHAAYGTAREYFEPETVIRLRQGPLQSLHNGGLQLFGNPMRPPRLEVPRSLKSTYYRGNDERDEHLFNNGNYCTSLMRIALADARGAALTYGDAVPADGLCVVVRLQPGPHIHQHFFSDEAVKKYFLTMQFHPLLGAQLPLRDPVPFHVENGDWVARFAVPNAGAASGQLKGVIYIGERRPIGGGREATRFHYGIEYALDVAGGRIGETSDLWMGPTYITPNLVSNHVSYSEWLSPVPLPSLAQPRKGAKEEEERESEEDKHDKNEGVEPPTAK